MEDLVGRQISEAFRGRSVLVTGHTGFKGSWLTLWLALVDASVTGYALAPPTTPSLFEAAGVASRCRSLSGDIRDLPRLRDVLRDARPSVVFHLAAQALVRRAYAEPLETIDTNVTGTTCLLEAVRLEGRPCAVVIVTSDKCYTERESGEGYREDDPLGGRDPYSASKAAAEVVTAAYRSSFFPPERLHAHGVAVATVRAGNVIGGGDWASDRIVPDAIRALGAGLPIPVRNPRAIRPWQHVLEPLGGYLLLGARLLAEGTNDPASFCGPWNFGPRPESAQPVFTVVDALIRAWGAGSWADRSDPASPPESARLLLSNEKSSALLGWRARWSLAEAIGATAEWYRAHLAGGAPVVLNDLCARQIGEYLGEASA